MIKRDGSQYVSQTGERFDCAEDVPIGLMLKTILEKNRPKRFPNKKPPIGVWTQRRIQKATGLGQAHISRLISDKKHNVMQRHFIAVLKLFKEVVG